jgi:excisionase family DNA binding protein
MTAFPSPIPGGIMLVMNASDYYTTKEAAAVLGVDSSTLRRAAIAGELTGALKLGRDWFIPRALIDGGSYVPRPKGWPKRKGGATERGVTKEEGGE